MAPLADRAREGRANAKGIPCLYVASHQETAIAEVRPWIGSFVSVARMKIHRKLRVINCTTHDTSSIVHIGGEPPPSKREEAVWADIDRAFAQPVSVDDDHAAYAPTQVIAELFKMHGFDGIAYRSSLGPGHNMALFDLTMASVAACTLVVIKSVKLVSRRCAAPYCVRESFGQAGAFDGG
jgi:RES domain-containing protein